MCVNDIYLFFVLYFIVFLTILTYDGEIHLLTYLLTYLHLAHRSLRDQSDFQNRLWVIHKHFKNVQKMNLGEETPNISQKLPFQKHVSWLVLARVQKSRLSVPAWLRSPSAHFTDAGMRFRTELVAAQRIKTGNFKATLPYYIP